MEPGFYQSQQQPEDEILVIRELSPPKMGNRFAQAVRRKLVKGLGDRAVTVLGNHDLHLLAVAEGFRKSHPKDTVIQILQAPDRDELLHWLRHRPVIHHDIDLGFTPASNTNAIRRLNLSRDEAADTIAVWLDTGDWTVKSLRQSYRRGNGDTFDYISPQHDYRATLIVDDVFVPDYRTPRSIDGFLCQNPGQEVNTGPLYPLPWAQVFVRSVSTAAFGGAQAAINAGMAIMQDRVSTNTGKASKQDPILPAALARAISEKQEMETTLRLTFDELMGYAERGEDIPMEKRAFFTYQSSTVVRRLARLIDDVLDFQKLNAGKMKFDMRENRVGATVEEAYATMQPQAAKSDVELTLDLETDLPPIVCDRDRIIQALTNLISNAVKFTPPGGRIVISAHRRAEHLVLQVSDTGLGIPKEDLPKIFDRFYRVQRPGQEIKGTGLGLAIVSRIVVAHGGRIEVESEPGQGTTFTVLLPQASGQTADGLNRPADERIERTLTGG